METETIYTEDSLNAVHTIQRTVYEMDDVIYAMKALGIPAGDKLEDIRNHLLTLSNECSTHLIQEQYEQLKNTQDQTWNLVGAVLTDVTSKLK